MKPNKAPKYDRVWVENQGNTMWVTDPHSTRYSMFVRYDAFIEETVLWFSERFNKKGSLDPNDIKDFKKGIKP